MFVKKPAAQWIAAVGFFKSSGYRSAFKGSAVKSQKIEAQETDKECLAWQEKSSWR
jgi:hypothetical protein